MIVLLLAACAGNITYSGFAMADFFPFDGERTWEFTNTDASVGYTVHATLDSASEMVDGIAVYTVRYTQCDLAGDSGDCTPVPWRLSEIRWSSGGGGGVLIHGYTDTSGPVTLAPPLMLAESQGAPRDVWTTDTAGQTFTSTFSSLSDCPVQMDVEWTDCAHLDVDDDADPATATTHPLAGQWVAVAGFNVIAMQLSGDPGQWQLSDATFN